LRQELTGELRFHRTSRVNPGWKSGSIGPGNQQLERSVGISTETLALFVRFWLTITPPLPSDAQATAQVKGRERYEGFIEALGRRLEKSKACFSRFQTTSQEAQCRKRPRIQWTNTEAQHVTS